MSWDDDKGNPWKSNGDKGPADLDAIVRDLQRKLSGFLGGRGGRGDSGEGERFRPSGSAGGGVVFGAIVLVIGLWCL
ncbi:MAG: protease modulator HflK, partial [Gammaproteobacteria bacterium]|nr:protease modulator HflK [Gammaproteobacteria bacterium]